MYVSYNSCSNISSTLVALKVKNGKRAWESHRRPLNSGLSVGENGVAEYGTARSLEHHNPFDALYLYDASDGACILKATLWAIM